MIYNVTFAAFDNIFSFFLGTTLLSWFTRVSSEEAFKKAIDKLFGSKTLLVCQVGFYLVYS